MPKYRKLYTKIVDSLDFTEMPDDFTRVTWLLLIVIVDSAGRGIYNASWIRSKMFPLREDVDSSKIIKCFEWFQKRGMIKIYQVDNRSYFEVNSFKDYQTGLENEAVSLLPASPELLPTNYEVNSEKDSNKNSLAVCVYESVYESVSESDKNEISQMKRDETQSNARAEKLKRQVDLPELPANLNYPEFLSAWQEWENYRKEIKKPLKPTSIKAQYKLLSEYGLAGAITSLEQSITNGWIGIFEPKPPPREYSNGGGRRFEAEHPPLDIDNSIEVAPRV